MLMADMADKTAKDLHKRRNQDVLIDIRGIRALFKLGRTAAYELTHRPEFPPHVVVSRRCYRWWASEVDAFAAALRDRPTPQQSSSAQRTPAQQTHPSSSTPRRITGRVRSARPRKGKL